MANKDNEQIIQDYMERINARLLRGDSEYYDPESKTYLVGTFYVHEGLDYFEFREVTDEKGGYRNVGGVEFGSIETLTTFLEGFLTGHYETCDTLDIDIEESEINVDTFDPNDPQHDDLSQEEKDAIVALQKAQAEERNKK